MLHPKIAYYSVMLLVLSMPAAAFTELPDAVAVSDDELDTLRGGFMLANGMNVEFSIDKVITLNGQVAFTSSFTLPDGVPLFQNGLNNISPFLNASPIGSIIQNNLDSQTISTINTINLQLSHINHPHLNIGATLFTDIVLPNVYK
jgi:hypothetical protein